MLPWEQSLRRNGSFVYLIDNQGREQRFVNVELGHSIYNPLRADAPGPLLKAATTCCRLRTTSSSTSAKCRTTASLFRCNASMHSVITCISAVPRGTLTDISATGNVHVHLQYEHPLGLADVGERIVNKEAVETTRYHYDDNGQLSDVYNRNGEVHSQLLLHRRRDDPPQQCTGP
ncbi:hypothetical protein [Pseudomonas syringae]